MTILNAHLEGPLMFYPMDICPLSLDILQQMLSGMYTTYHLSPLLLLLTNRLPLQGLINTAVFSLGLQVNVKAADLLIQPTTILDVSTLCGAIKQKAVSGRDQRRVPTYK